MSDDILLEGRVLKKQKIGRIWIENNNIFCIYEGQPMLLKEFEYPDWAEFILKNFFLPQLGRV